MERHVRVIVTCEDLCHRRRDVVCKLVFVDAFDADEWQVSSTTIATGNTPLAVGPARLGPAGDGLPLGNGVGRVVVVAPQRPTNLRCGAGGAVLLGDVGARSFSVS